MAERLNPTPLDLAQDAGRDHWLAHALASGASPGSAAAEVGFSRTTVEIKLTQEPFQKLVADYRELLDDADFRRADLALVRRNFRRLCWLEDRLFAQWEHAAREWEEAIKRGEPPPPKSMLPAKSILDHLEAHADRLGYGKHQTTKVEMGVEQGLAERLAGARRDHFNGKVINNNDTPSNGGGH